MHLPGFAPLTILGFITKLTAVCTTRLPLDVIGVTRAWSGLNWSHWFGANSIGSCSFCQIVSARLSLPFARG